MPLRAPGETHGWIGKSVQRKRDPEILTGRGVYIDDVKLPRMLHAAALRSPYAHAKIINVDATKARELKGVVSVLSGSDAAEYVGANASFCAEQVPQHAVAIDKVRFAGEAVAIVAATDRYIAEDACELIEVEYEPLPALADMFSAMEPSAPKVHDTLANNVVFEKVFNFGPIEEDFARADHIIRRKLRWHRMSAQPIETGGAVASFEPSTGNMEVWSNTNMYNFIPWVYAEMLGVKTHQLKMIPTLVGGSFGSKHVLSKCVVFAGALSKASGRPVKFIEDRVDNLSSSDNVGPDREYEAELAVSNEGDFLGLRLKILDDYGAYFRFAHGPHGNALAQPVGPYRIGSLQYDLKCILTNKDQQGFFRGAGSDPGNFAIERLADAAAEELGIAREEIRRRNFIAPDEFPYKIPTGNIYDSGNYERVLEIALEKADMSALKAEQEELRKKGRYIGIGLATCQERSAYSATEWWFLYEKPPFPLTSTPESLRLHVDATGGFVATIGSPFWGQSAETVVTQVISEEFGIDPEVVSVELGTSRSGLLSAGPGGSRLTVMLAGAAVGASEKLKKKLLRIAAHSMGESSEALEVSRGGVRRKEGIGEISIGDLAMQAHLFQLDLPESEEGGLTVLYNYAHPYATQPNAERTDLGSFYPIVAHACHIPIVEVDIKTGAIEIIRYVAVHDSGTVVNPKGLVGQVVGGIAQGIGAALMEECVFDNEGQLLSSTFGEYLLPSIYEVPDIEVYHHETPSPFTEYGINGAGVGGRLVAPTALASAIEDALSPFGVKVSELPMTPERVLTAI
ncbi:xanthine dehydrogenase family protein molybdopterin-binding subunit, partial [Myxococcota bacterium]|nr:xanthine dehydrogenase family protein molybdopterin-binding subunit [Myxococcota bacterium]